jgi:hypothetical protein
MPVPQSSRHKPSAGEPASDGVRVSTEDGWWLLRAQHPTRAAAPCEAADEAGLERLKCELKVVLSASGVEFIDERRAINTSPSRSAARTFLSPRGLRQPGEIHGPPPRLFLEKHSDRLRDPGIIPEMEPSHVLPHRVLDGEAGGTPDHTPRPRKSASHFLGPHAALYEPNYRLRSFRTGHHPADLCRQYRRHHFGAEFVSLAEGYAGGETPSHSVRLEDRRSFHDDDADWSTGVAANQQEVRHGSIDLLAP